MSLNSWIVLIFYFQRSILTDTFWEVRHENSLPVACTAVTCEKHIAALFFTCRRSKARNKLLSIDILVSPSVESWLVVYNVLLIYFRVLLTKRTWIDPFLLLCYTISTMGKITGFLGNLV